MCGCTGTRTRTTDVTGRHCNQFNYTPIMFGSFTNLCLHYSIENPGPVGLVPVGGLEPPSPPYESGVRNQLRYTDNLMLTRFRTDILL